MERNPQISRRTFLRGAAYGAGGLATAALVGCSTAETRAETPTPEQTKEATITPTVTPKEITTRETATPTTNETSETSTPTSVPETKEVVDCQILPEEFCGNASLVEWEVRGETHMLLAFSLPEGTKIYSRDAGQLTTAELNEGFEPFNGKLGVVLDPADGTKPSVTFMGDIKFKDTSKGNEVGEGDEIGEIQNSGVENPGRFNLFVDPVRVNLEKRKSEPDFEFIESTFPSISRDTEPELVAVSGSR